MVPEALGDVYPICLCLDICVSALALPDLTGLPPTPAPFSHAHPLSASPQLSLFCLAPAPPPGLEWREWQAEWRELQTWRSAFEKSAGCSSLLQGLLLLWSLGVGVGASKEAAGGRGKEEDRQG